MADTTNLERFLKDIADSIRAKKNVEGTIQAELFDEEIEGIVTGTVVEKIEVPAEQVLEVSDAVKVVSTPIEEPIVIPENGVAEVDVDKTVLAESIGLAPEKIVQGEVVLDVVGIAEGGNGGADTSDATATINDVLYPKTFYSGGKKQVGTIETTYDEDVGTINGKDMVAPTNICDYREDLGYYLMLNSSNNTVGVYSIKDDTLVKSFNTTSKMTRYDSTYNLSVCNAKFSKTPIRDKVYAVVVNSYCYASTINEACYLDGVGVGVFDIDNPEYTETEYITAFGTNGYDFNMYNRTYGTDLVESNGYVYSTILANSNYYRHQDGHTKFYYIDHKTKKVVYKCQFRVGVRVGTIAHMSDNGRFISVMSSGYADVLQVSANYNSITALKQYTPDASNPRPIITDDGVIYDKKYVTAEGILHTYTSLPFGWNDTVIYNKGYLVRFDGTSVIRMYKLDKTTYEITPYKAMNISGTPNISYYGENGRINISNYPISNTNGIMFTTGTGRQYTIVPNVTAQRLTSALIGGEMFCNVSNVDTSADKLLVGNTMYNYNGKVNGAMPNNGALNYTPSTEEQSIPAGYTSGGKIAAVTSDIDSNIVAEHIKTGVTILGVEGTLEKIEGGSATQDGNLLAKYLLEGYSAVVDDTLIEGTMANYGTTEMTYTEEDQEIPTGYYDELHISYAPATTFTGYDECSEALQFILTGDTDEYTELNYIQSTGTQWIDTGIIPTNDTKMIVEYNPLDNSEGNVGINADFGIHYGTVYNCFFGSRFTGSINKIADTRTKLTLDNTGLYVNDELSCAISGNVTSTYTVPLFAYIESTGTKYISSGRIYSCKFYENNELVRDFIPMRRNADLAVGLYDNVTQQFFSNVGTENFISGGVKE